MKKTILSITLLLLAILSNAQSYLTSIPFTFPDTTSILNLRPRNFIKCDAQNNVWVGFGSEKLSVNYIFSTIGLAKFNNGNWTTYNTANSNIATNDITSLDFQNNILWIGSKAGLIKFDGTTFSVYNKQNSNITNDTINDVSVSGNTIWVTSNNGVSKFDGTTFTNYTTSNTSLTTNLFTKIASVSSSSAYVGSLTGLFLINGNAVTAYNTQNSGILSNKITALHLDKSNTLWIAADSSKFDNSEITCIHYLKNNTIKNLQLDNINSKGCLNNLPLICRSIVSDANGNVYFTNNISSQTSQIIQPTFVKINTMETKNYEIKLTSLWSNYSGIFTLDNTNKIYLLNALYQNNLKRILKIDLDNVIEDKGDTSARFLDINQISTPYNSKYDVMNWDSKIRSYEVPKGTCKKTIFASNLWIGGITQNVLRLAAQTYRQTGTDYFPGPIAIDTVISNPDPANLEELSKTWKINRFDIEALKINYANGNIANGSYKIPNDILTWPAKGKGLYNRNYAPFEDINKNGIYEPTKGEYPIIKGDQMIYWICNDNGTHTETTGLPLGIEIHASIYAYQCNDYLVTDSNSVINYITFNHFDIYNRSKENIDSLRLGIWVDNDLGNYADDYIGCNPKEGYSYCYNGDDNDEGSNGYGLNPPISSTLFLKTPLENNTEVGFGKFVYYNNDLSQQGNPSSPQHYWNYLNGKWKDGLPITYGGIGRGGIDTASFMFCGTNDLVGRSNWNESTAGNTPGDRRSLSVMNLFTLKPNDKKSIDYAHIYTKSNSGGALGSFNKLSEEVKKIKNWYKTNSFPSCLKLNVGLNNEIENSNLNKVIIYPNPTNGLLSISSSQTISNINVFDITGKLVYCKQNDVKQSNTEIDLSALSNGIYLINVETINGGISKNKIVISK